MIATVKYQYGAYSGEVKVNCSEDDCNEDIIARAKNELKKYMCLPMAYESYKVISRD